MSLKLSFYESPYFCKHHLLLNVLCVEKNKVSFIIVSMASFGGEGWGEEGYSLPGRSKIH